MNARIRVFVSALWSGYVEVSWASFVSIFALMLISLSPWATVRGLLAIVWAVFLVRSAFLPARGDR